jgi:hypothetical protein
LIACPNRWTWTKRWRWPGESASGVSPACRAEGLRWDAILDGKWKSRWPGELKSLEFNLQIAEIIDTLKREL